MTARRRPDLLIRAALTAAAALAAMPSAASAGITIEIQAAVGPNSATSSSQADFWTWSANAIHALERGLRNRGDCRTDPTTCYQVLDGFFDARDVMVTTGKSWRGEAIPAAPFNDQHGQRVHFGLRAVGDGTVRFRLRDLSVELATNDGVLDYSNDFATLGWGMPCAGDPPQIRRIGYDWGSDRRKGGGDDTTVCGAGANATYVDELIYSGFGNAYWPDSDLSAADSADKQKLQAAINRTIADVDSIVEWFSGKYEIVGDDGVTYRGARTLQHERLRVTAPPPAPGVGVSPTALSVPEGSAASYTVRLETAPSSNVTIRVRRSFGGDTDLSVTDPDSARLTFTSFDWNEPQTVTVSAARDRDDVGGRATFTHSAASADAGYHGISIASVTASEVDDGPPSRLAPYWRGGGGFVVRPSDGRSAEVRLECGGHRSGSVEYAGEDGLIVRLIPRSRCEARDGRPLEGDLTFHGVDDGGWYWINGDRNVAVSPLVVEASLDGRLRPPAPGGVTAEPSGDRLFVRVATGRHFGTLVAHDGTGFIGIVPHLADLAGQGEHVAPYWKGHGGVVGRPLDGNAATFRLSCENGVTESRRLEAGEDGLVVSLLPGCFDGDGEPIGGELEADGLEDGAWYWLNSGRRYTGDDADPPRSCRPGACSFVAPFLGRNRDPAALTVPLVPGGVEADGGPLGTLFTQGSRMGIVPRLRSAPP